MPSRLEGTTRFIGNPEPVIASINERIGALKRLRADLTQCIGCGCVDVRSRIPVIARSILEYVSVEHYPVRCMREAQGSNGPYLGLPGNLRWRAGDAADQEPVLRLFRHIAGSVRSHMDSGDASLVVISISTGALFREPRLI